MYTRQQIIEIVKTHTKDMMKKSEWMEYVDDAASTGELMLRSLNSFGLDSWDISQLLMFVADELGITFDDKDFTKPYSQMTFGDIVDLAFKNCERQKNNYNPKKHMPIVNQLAKPQKVIDQETIEKTLNRVFDSFGLATTDRDKTFLAHKCDFMDALALMNNIEIEFGLPNGYLSDTFEQRNLWMRNATNFFDIYNNVTYNDIFRFLRLRFGIPRPTIVNTLIITGKQKTL